MHVANPTHPAHLDVNDDQATDRPLLQFLRFSVGPDAYAVRIELVREILVAAKQGLLDPEHNPRLRSAIAAAKAQSVPRDRIEKAIKP